MLRIQDLAGKILIFKFLPARFGKFKIVLAKSGIFKILQARLRKFKILSTGFVK